MPRPTIHEKKCDFPYLSYLNIISTKGECKSIAMGPDMILKAMKYGLGASNGIVSQT